MPTDRRQILAAAAGLCALAVAGLGGIATAEPRSAINTLGGDGVAIRGHDPVAYFASGRPAKGDPRFSVEHGGARWLFASEANKRRFEADPGRYMPAYGGYCAYGTARGYLVEIDPNAWAIVNDRLYLNYDRSVQAAWMKDAPGFIRRADAHWPRLSRAK